MGSHLMIKISPHVGSYEYATQEDRSAQRTRIAIPGYLRAVGSRRLVTTTRDISRSGYAAVAMTRMEPGTKCWLSLPDTPPLEAQVVWWEGGIVGCAFTQMLSTADLEQLIGRWGVSSTVT